MYDFSVWFWSKHSQVCMAISKKKAIHVLSVTEDRIIPLKEISLPEPPLHMVREIIIKFNRNNTIWHINFFLLEWLKSSGLTSTQMLCFHPANCPSWVPTIFSFQIVGQYYFVFAVMHFSPAFWLACAMKGIKVVVTICFW